MCTMAANYIIEKTNEYNKNRSYTDQIILSGKRLQKMLFFCDVKYMLDDWLGRSMFSDDYHAWPSGPVIPSVYYDFMQFQSGTMRPVEGGKHSPLTPRMKKTIDEVFDKTKNIDTSKLIEYTHVCGGPWSQVYRESDPDHDQIIPKRSIYKYYKKNKKDIEWLQ